MTFVLKGRKYWLLIAFVFAIFVRNTFADSIFISSDLPTLTLTEGISGLTWTSTDQPICDAASGPTVDLSSNGDTAKSLALTNWGFTFPGTVTINRINFNFTRYISSAASVRDSAICIFVSPGDCQLQQPVFTTYSTSEETSSYSITTNLPSQSFIASNNFGVRFSAIKTTGSGGTITVYLTCVGIEVVYTTSTSGVISTGAFTSSVVTTSPITTGSGSLTSGSLTSGSLTSGISITSGGAPPVTTNAPPQATTGIAAQGSTTQRVTSGSLTSARVTTGRGVSTTGVSLVTTDAITTASSTPTGDGNNDGNAVSPSDSTGGNRSNIPIIAGAAGGAVVLLIVIIIIVAVVVSRKKQREYKRQQSYPSMISEMGLMKTPKLSENPIKPPPKNYTSVKDVGVASDQNARFRKQMEDEHVIVDKYGGVDTDGYFAVYDGHGGRATAEYVKEHLHHNILKEAATKPMHEALYDAYLSTDKELKSKGEKSGCTAVSAVIKKMPDGKRTLFVANAGDARITLRRGTKGIRLTKDHKVTDEDEIKRIEARGGMIFGGKVGASLAVTRAFGDSEMRDWVIAEAQINQTDLTPDDSHLIIACDGLWDVVSDQEAVDLISRDYTAQESADKLLQYALAHETKDNVSVIVLKL